MTEPEQPLNPQNEAETEEERENEPLDGPAPDRPATVTEVREAINQFDGLMPTHREDTSRRHFEAAFTVARLTFDDLGPMARTAAYRVTRTWLYLTNSLSRDESLTARDLPWTQPTPFTNDKHLRPVDRINYAASIAALRAHPAPVLPHAAMNGCVRAWTNIVRAIAADIGVDKPSSTFPFASEKFVRTLTRPENALRLWPTAKQLVARETEIICEMFENMDRERLHGVLELQRLYGFSHDEAVAMLPIALDYGRTIYTATPEQERALTVFRVERAAKAAAGALDHRGAVSANKQIALVVGLGRAEVEDIQSDFARLAGKVTAPPQIPMRPPIDAQPIASRDVAGPPG